MANKITDFEKYRDYIKTHDMANLFNVYDDDIVNNGMYYNINRTLMFVELENVDPNKFIYYTVKELDNWNIISYKEYNTTRLWWIVCKINGISDPMTEPSTGDILRLLPISDVNTLLSKVRGA